MFCTYVTFYRGNLLPPFYIGYSSVQKVANGYHGSVLSKEYKDIWKSELKNNPSRFTTKIISYHENRSDAKKKETDLQRAVKAHRNLLYVNKTISGKDFYCTGHSEDTKEKIRKNHPRLCGSSSSMYGRRWITNGRESRSICVQDDIPEGWNLGRKIKPLSSFTRMKMCQPRSESHRRNISNGNIGRVQTQETREKISKKAKERTGSRSSQYGTMWITNGTNSKKIKKQLDIIPKGWYKGRVIKVDHAKI